MSSGGGHGGGGLPFLGSITSFTHSLHAKHGVHLPLWPFPTLFIIQNFLFLLFAPAQTFQNYELLLFLSPLWLPLLLVRFMWIRRADAMQYAYGFSQDKVLLEIRIPREVKKTPLAMQSFFTSIHLSPGEGTWYKKHILGRTRPTWSFELVSIEGQVHFCVWTRESFRRAIETYLYAEYPGIEIIEIPDFLRTFELDQHEKHRVWSCEYALNIQDPAPIKSFVDFGLDKPGLKPEEVADPLSHVIEFLGSLGKGERAWLQLIVQTHKGGKYNRKNAAGKTYTWKDEGYEMIQEIKDSTVSETQYVDAVTGKLVKSKGFPNPTKGQVEYMGEIGRNVSMPAFDIGIRALYVADKDRYFGTIGAHLSQIFRVFAGSNVLGPHPSVGSEKFSEFPWEDPSGHHYQHEMQYMFDLAKRRTYFHYPYKGPNMVMSTESLATLYHIPSSTTITPGLPRIQSTTSEAPSNLPI